MNNLSIINLIAAGTHRVRAYGIKRGRTRYLLEKLNEKHGWLPVEAHCNAIRRAVRGLPHHYDMILGVVYDAAAINQNFEVAA